MLDNQHKLIKGYRDLSQREIDLMNAVKEKSNELGEIIKELELETGLDQRWVAEAKTHLQIGTMLAVRSIAQPTTFG
jgi:hypothetical protein